MACVSDSKRDPRDIQRNCNPAHDGTQFNLEMESLDGYSFSYIFASHRQNGLL